MGRLIRVLIVDDSNDDAELEAREIARAGYEVESQRVQSESALISALNTGEWDVVLGDYTMPGFSGTDALKIVRDFSEDLPFIFVSGTIGEEVAVASMRSGAQDYVVKENLGRLLPAIERELAEAEMKKQRRAAEHDRKIAEARFEHIVDTAPDAIVAADGSQQIVVFNEQAEELFGYKRDEVMGQPLEMLMPPRFGVAHRHRVTGFRFSQVKARNMSERSEIAGLRKNGDEFPAEASISKLKEDSGTFFIAVVKDITQRKQTQAQLLHAQKMESIGQLVGGLAHDFNNLLTIAIGNLDFLSSIVEQDEEAAELVNAAYSACTGGAELTRSLLAYARSQALSTREFDLNEMVERSISLLGRTLEENIEIETRLGEELWKSYADPTQAESALTNLAINARDAMPNGGRLCIETRNVTLDGESDINGDFTLLAVSDTGEGMDDETLQRCTEPFFTTKGPGRGSGLGLSMIYGFAKQSNGHVEIESQPEKGTTIRLYLPRSTGKQTTLRRHESNGAGRSVNLRVLVVDDNLDIRNLCARHLVAMGHEVRQAGDGSSALDLLDVEEFDLVITDLMMPGLSGIEVARSARKLQPFVRVLFSSGYVDLDPKEQQELDQLGFFLPKPFSRAQLVEKVAEIYGSEEVAPYSHPERDE